MSINDIPKDKDYIDNGFDSTIHTDNMYLYKSYFAHITKEVLEDYHTIHTYLSQFEREFDLPKIKPYKSCMTHYILYYHRSRQSDKTFRKESKRDGNIS